MDKRAQARKVYDHNKRYVLENMEQLTWQECAAFIKKQDALYSIFSETIKEVKNEPM